MPKKTRAKIPPPQVETDDVTRKRWEVIIERLGTQYFIDVLTGNSNDKIMLATTEKLMYGRPYGFYNTRWLANRFKTGIDLNDPETLLHLRKVDDLCFFRDKGRPPVEELDEDGRRPDQHSADRDSAIEGQKRRYE